MPDLVASNTDASGKDIGGIIGGIIGGKTGAAILGGIDIKKKTADVVLTVTDVRSSVQMAMIEGHASKKDVGWKAGGGIFAGVLAAGGANSYENTEIGQVIAAAYLDAYIQLVDEFRALPENAAQSNVMQAVTMTRPGRMYATSNTEGAVVRTVSVGMMLYPTGAKDGVMWEVEDELGNKGWVSSLLFELAK